MSIDDLLRFEHLARRRLTRRDLLRATGKGGVGIVAAGLLAACGGLGADTAPTQVPAIEAGPGGGWSGRRIGRRGG